MYLKNSQYQEILRLYDEKQARQRRLLEQRRQAIYDAFPEYAKLEDEITSLWASGARGAARRAWGSYRRRRIMTSTPLRIWPKSSST